MSEWESERGRDRESQDPVLALTERERGRVRGREEGSTHERDR